MEWQPIETAPKDGMRILAFAQGSYTRDYYYGVAQWAFADPDLGSVAGWFWDFAIRPTHWIPLPEPPLPDVEFPNPIVGSGTTKLLFGHNITYDGDAARPVDIAKKTKKEG